jgi:hypothetical protein
MDPFYYSLLLPKGPSEGYWERVILTVGVGLISLVVFIFNFLIILFYFIVHLFTCAYIVWVISPPCPLLPPFPPSSVSGRSCSALIIDFVEEDICIVRKTKHFC